MPLDDIEMGRLLERIDELSAQVENMNSRLTQWQPIIDEALKQQTTARSRNLTLTTMAVGAIAIWLVTMAVWYIRSGNPVPVNTIPMSAPVNTTPTSAPNMYQAPGQSAYPVRN